MPSKFDIMRRNRSKLARARETLRARIDRIEQEMTAEWDAEDTADLVRTFEQLEQPVKRPQPRRSPLRRLVNWTMGMGAHA